MQTAKTVSLSPSEENDIIQKISVILDTWNEKGSDMSFLKKKIEKILSQTQKKDYKPLALHLLQHFDRKLFDILPEVLKQDKEVVLAALDAWTPLAGIPERFQSDEEVLEHALEWLIQEGSVVFEFVDIFEKKKLPKKLKNALKERFIEALAQKEYSFDNELESALFELYLADFKSFQMLRSLPLFRYQNTVLTLDTWFITACCVAHPDDSEQKQESSTVSLYEKLLEYCKLSQVTLPPALERVLKALLQQVSLEHEKKRVKQNKEDAETEKEKKSKTKKERENSTSQETVTVDELVLPYRSFSYAGHYTLWDESWHVTYLAETELQQMSERALENYFEFSKLLTHLQLDFLLRKHASRIMLATGVNFYKDAWMTEARTLHFLNNIGKNIGIPESSYSTHNPENPEEKIVWCFHTLDAAKKEFHEIAETWTIAGQKVCDPISRGDQSIVEIFMKQQGLITPPYFEISLARWRY